MSFLRYRRSKHSKAIAELLLMFLGNITVSFFLNRFALICIENFLLELVRISEANGHPLKLSPLIILTCVK